MYKISIPIRNHTVTPQTREAYLKLAKDSSVDRIFLTRSDFCETEAEEREMIENLRENLDFFRSHGFEVGVWVGNTTGHGNTPQKSTALVGMKSQTAFADLTPIVNIKGEALWDTRCPMDPRVRALIKRQLTAIAKAGPETILLDDDFRMSHGSEHCCACDLHMKRICEICGEELDRAELEKLVFHAPANKYRHAWLQAQGEALRTLATDIREAVDAVDPSIRLAPCSSHGLWDWDGLDAVEAAKILAGNNNPPLVRLLDAPYIAVSGNKKLPAVLERARMFAAFAKDSGMELMSEGDVYPRPRYHVPASYLEIFDAVMRIDGIYDGILKYMVDYNATPNYETGYFERHAENLPMMEALTEMFAGKDACGVRTPERPHLLSRADLSLGVDSHYYPYPLAGTMLTFCSIPTLHTEGGICNAIFGEEARYSTEAELKKGAIIDAIAAVLLTERGVDVGLNEIGAFSRETVSFLRPADLSERAYLTHGDIRYLTASLKDGATVLELAEVEERLIPIAYRYENADGQRFLVYLYDTLASPFDCGIQRGYLQQGILTEQVEWIARQKLPVTCLGNPDLFVMCKEKDGKMAVALFNCYADSILHPAVKLGEQYQSIRFLNTDGSLCGDTVTLNRPIPAFEFVAFEVSKS
ncbi:MAG: hypothetical protein J6B71_09110 [Clostridia bacterium]|nr:hypothetical protein [Clostridia bacterium]